MLIGIAGDTSQMRAKVADEAQQKKIQKLTNKRVAWDGR